MYTLTLTADERQAIDWVGGRYRHGDELYRLLWVESEYRPLDDWCSEEDITFTLPETVAWDICEILDESVEGLTDEFVDKLRKFQEGVV